jgi:hydroxyacylglutathione hydrolase
MKTGVKRIMTCMAGVLFSVLVLVILFSAKFHYETSKMSPVVTKQIAENVFVVKDDFVNMYLIKNQDNYIVIDAGIHIRKIREELAELNIRPENVQAVFLTHTHSDHIGGLSLFTNAEVYLSKKEKFRSHKKINTLDDNVLINISGIKVQCVYTPGHTAGSVCYRINDNLLFVGDTLSIKNGKAAVFNKFFNKDTKEQTESIKKLSQLKSIGYIYTAHYGYLKNNNEFYINFN